MAGQPVRLHSNGQFVASAQPVAVHRLGQQQPIATHRLGQPQPFAAQRLGPSQSIMAAQRIAPPQPVQYSEYQLRVPKNLVKKYNVMTINAPRPIKLDEVKEANMIRKTRKQVYVEEEGSTTPQYGAGSVYKSDQKEEAKKKKRGYITKRVSRDDLPYALRLGGKGGKKYTGRKEATILEHSAYFIFTQTADGVFEAIPVQGWYNFIPDVAYTTLTADEVEVEFSRRTKSIEFISQKYKLKENDGEDEKVSKVQDRDGSLIIHDDIDYDLEDDLELSDEDDQKKPSTSSAAAEKKGKGKGKTRFHGKKKHQTTESGSEPEDSDEEEELDRGESKEVDYMSESSSEDEEKQMDDDPEPEVGNREGKAKDDLNVFSDSNSDSDAEEENKDLNEAGKELRAIMKKEAGDEDGAGSSDDEDEDDDEDLDEEKYSKSALFMQEGKKKKGGSKSGSRSNTPNPPEGSSATSDASGKTEKIGSKRPSSRLGQTDSPTPGQSSKKVKLEPSVEARRSPSSRSATPVGGESSSSSGTIAITEELIRKHLLHKPLTTTDLVRKFKTKRTGLSKEQTVAAIAAVLKRIAPTQQKIDGKLYLSLRPNNGKK